MITANPGQHLPETIQSSWRVDGNNKNAHPVHRGVPQSTRGADSVTLDGLVCRENLGKVDFIKIDVDGAEDDVIQGGEHTICSFRPIILIEVAPYTLIERGLPGDAPLKRLLDMGYSFEDTSGHSLESDHRSWVNAISVGFGRDIVARPE
jgi:hypothetical protein